MITMELARRLRDEGLEWVPAEGDRFFIPDRNLDDQVFSVSEMTVDVMRVGGDSLIAFNGTVEWALDSIMHEEAVWLPSEEQLRTLPGEDFVALRRTGDGYRCEIDADGGRLAFEHPEAAGSYGLALLHRLRTRGAAPLRT